MAAPDPGRGQPVPAAKSDRGPGSAAQYQKRVYARLDAPAVRRFVRDRAQ